MRSVNSPLVELMSKSELRSAMVSFALSACDGSVSLEMRRIACEAEIGITNFGTAQ